MVAAAVAGVAAFVAMEPAAYAAHRWVMHGAGWALHRSHHDDGPLDAAHDRLEANDWFPVGFAAATVAALAAGTGVPGAHLLVPVGAGVTAYGAVYALVHDVCIHRRVRAVRVPAVAPIEWLRRAHAVHHRYGGEPYGMLCPLVPRALRELAASDTAAA